jgi:hypothetical protein
MKRFFNIISGLGTAIVICILLSAGSIFLAFKGAEKAGALMSTPPALGFSAVVALLLLLRGCLALARRGFDSALLHLGCALAVGGWLWGQVAAMRVRAATPDRAVMMSMMQRAADSGEKRPKPLKGSMALVEGDVMNSLWEGAYLDQFVGKLDFTVKLDSFVIDYYESSPGDRSQGRMPPIREYCSRVTISEPGKEPYTREIRVNQPARIGDFLVYQMSWGQSTNMQNQPVTYTVLQFIRDPGLNAVYTGFVVLFVGILLFCVRLFRVPAGGEVRHAD